MPEIILHHYDLSPYAEKIRVALGVKGLAWRSVQIPIVAPKPKLTALTGGYRLTPVMQIGADVYCDTRCIARELERRHPTPTLHPGPSPAVERGLAYWGESMFMDVVALFLTVEGLIPPGFIEDRDKMIPGGIDIEQIKAVVPAKRDQLRAKLDILERHLAAGGPFLLGDRVSLADLSVYHPLWGLASVPPGGPLLEPCPSVRAWLARVAAIGHGTRQEMDADEALAVARAATPATAPGADPGDPNGRKHGARLAICPEAYGRDPVAGELVWSDAHEIAIKRTDPGLGEIVVHFPREGILTFAA
jgi:glutathione S-transferase